jgi:hypothetical protein
MNFKSGNNNATICSFFYGFLNIQNCYYNGPNLNSPLIAYMYLDLSNSLIISNSYTSSNNLIRQNDSNQVYIFNSYCNGKVINININNQPIYYNTFTPSTTVPTSSLTPITNKIDTNSQIDNIGSKVISGYNFTPSKWDTVNTWKVPSASTTDNDTYPTLKTNP